MNHTSQAPYRTSNRGTNYNSLVLVRQDDYITRNSHFVNQNKLNTQTQGKRTCTPFSHVYFERKENHCKINLT